jgi:hypothetical protein
MTTTYDNKQVAVAVLSYKQHSPLSAARIGAVGAALKAAAEAARTDHTPPSASAR